MVYFSANQTIELMTITNTPVATTPVNCAVNGTSVLEKGTINVPQMPARR